MKESDYEFTNRMTNIAELASKITSSNVVYPHHLFVAACQEATGVCGELYLYLHKRLGPQFIDYLLNEFTLTNEKGHSINHLVYSSSSLEIIHEANKLKEKYNQRLINEGHILHSILRSTNEFRRVFDQDTINDIINIACVPRDLIVYLNDINLYSPDDSLLKIRRVSYPELDRLKHFIRAEFGDRWLKTIESIKEKYELPVFIVEENGEIIGFACFDVVRNKKGLFGPMGVAGNRQLKSVGKELLFRCLLEMKSVGYEYAVIGQAGPLEFYERVCNAKIIPKSN